MKERVTLTIEKEILEQVDSTIDGSLVKNRSHAFELLITKALGKHKLTKAFILAGGSDNPDYMVKLGGKPIIQHNIDLLRRYSVKDVIIATDNVKKIKQYFGDGTQFGVNITYIEEEIPMGTAGPLTLAKDYLTETFVMLNADEIKEIDLSDMYNFHKEHNGFATIALTTVHDPSKYGVALMNGSKISSFVEKPTDNNLNTNLINAGLYIMEPEVIDLIPEGFAKLENDLFPKLTNNEKLFGYPFSGRWIDSINIPKFKVSVKEKNKENIKEH